LVQTDQEILNIQFLLEVLRGLVVQKIPVFLLVQQALPVQKIQTVQFLHFGLVAQKALKVQGDLKALVHLMQGLEAQVLQLAQATLKALGVLQGLMHLAAHMVPAALAVHSFLEDPDCPEVRVPLATP